MYPPHRDTPGSQGEFDQYPMQDSSFSSRPINRGNVGYNLADPFDDTNTPYSDSMNQPLLNSPSPSPSGYFDNGSGVRFNPPASPGPHFGEAPRRQPRRYKTSKSFFSIGRVSGGRKKFSSSGCNQPPHKSCFSIHPHVLT
jgi:hypothetical protein